MQYLIKRGEVFWIKNNWKKEGSEIEKSRPAVVISNNNGNEHGPTAIVAFMTTSPKKPLPTHVEITETTTGNCGGSTVLLESINTISQTRIDTENDYLGRIKDEEMEKIDEAIKVSLGIKNGEYIALNDDTEPEVVSEDDEMEYQEHYSVETREMQAVIDKTAMERDFYKKKYEEIMERIMEKMMS